jgi:hypothetical protein
MNMRVSIEGPDHDSARGVRTTLKRRWEAWGSWDGALRNGATPTELRRYHEYYRSAWGS